MSSERPFDRRRLLQGALLAAGNAALGGSVHAQADEVVRGNVPEWMKIPGRGFTAYGMPSEFFSKVQRLFTILPGRPGTGTSRTPLHLLEGAITPNGLHFERHHNGVPNIDPALHRLYLHGLVKRPLSFTVENLHRYPMVSEIRFIECAGNSATYALDEPLQATAGILNGLISCSEWTGVRLSTLMEEAGIAKNAKWVIAEGADAAAMSRSIPIEKCLDDAMIALYQNGEPIRSEQGSPMRLLLPGFEGNMNVKWLRRLNVVDQAMSARDETAHYSELMRNGLARQYMLVQDVKSVIVKPSFGLSMRGPGFYEISGLAWSGAGRIRSVDVSVDGGKVWHASTLNAPVLSKAVTRFRMPWMWDGSPAILMSRATDETGALQPTRAEWVAQYAPGQPYHMNGIQGWSVSPSGEVRNVYA
jgi:sulfane dehydrogenase subunit SoxC